MLPFVFVLITIFSNSSALYDWPTVRINKSPFELDRTPPGKSIDPILIAYEISSKVRLYF